MTVGLSATIADPTVYTFGELYDKAEGATSFTVITIPKDVLPPELAAVTVYVPIGVIAVGVPEIIPVVVSKDNPAGSAGEIEYPETVPEIVGFKAAMAEPTV